MLNRNNNYWYGKFYNTNTIELVVDDPLQIKDTFITNTVADIKVLAFERKAQKFIELHDVTVNEEISNQQYAGGQFTNIMYQSRPTLKVGGMGASKYRSVLIFDVGDSVANAVAAVEGYTTGCSTLSYKPTSR
jgi:hypothetical protein